VDLKPRKCWLGLLVALCALPATAQALTPGSEEAVLSKLSCKAGDVVPVPIAVAVPGAVALQLDLRFDPAQLALAETSGTAIEITPGKQMRVYHVSRGLARLVVFGHDLAALPEGALGDVRFRALTDTSETPIAAPHRTVSDASGHPMATQVRGGVIVGMAGVNHE
jgi:hypothetical protein